MRTTVKGECGHEMDVEESDVGQWVTCPACGLATTATRPIPLPPPVPAVTLRPFVKELRGRTCYGTLRALIRFFFVAIYTVFSLCIVLGFLTAVTGMTAELYGLSPLAYMLAVVLIFGSATCVALAIHQAMLILIDIADATIFAAKAVHHSAIRVPCDKNH